MVTIRAACRFTICKVVCCLLIVMQCQALYSQTNVLIFSSGDPKKDTELEKLLSSYGHKVILGVEYPEYTGGGLTGVDVVFLQANQDWTNKVMPSSGQRELVEFVASGGGLIATRPVIWSLGNGSELSALRSALPAVPESTVTRSKSISYAQNSLDRVLNAGLPAYFSFETGEGVINETLLAPRPGATVFFQSIGGDSSNAGGVIGWNFGAGKVLAFSALLEEVACKDANCSRLLHNSVVWTSPIPEPSAGLLVALAVTILGMQRRRKI